MMRLSYLMCAVLAGILIAAGILIGVYANRGAAGTTGLQVVVATPAPGELGDERFRLALFDPRITQCLESDATLGGDTPEVCAYVTNARISVLATVTPSPDQ